MITIKNENIKGRVRMLMKMPTDIGIRELDKRLHDQEFFDGFKVIDGNVYISLFEIKKVM